MLSYKHAFHAGNHADIIKHIVLSLTFDIYKQKDKPFVYIDTHSGAGKYKLTEKEANTTGEYLDGILKIKDLAKSSDILKPYFDVLNVINHDDKITLYPGSPYFAKTMLRETDRMIFMELHNVEFEKLERNFGKDRRCQLHHRDGYEGINALTPPTPRRGIVMFDPSYEIADDYKKTITAVDKTIKKWNVSCVIVWYPLLSNAKDHSLYMHESFRKMQVKNSFIVKLCPHATDGDARMYGSAVTVLNAPFTLLEKIKNVLPLLHKLTQQSEKAKSTIEILRGE